MGRPRNPRSWPLLVVAGRLVVLGLLVMSTFPAHAQSRSDDSSAAASGELATEGGPVPQTVLVMDASGSMNGPAGDGTAKIDAAKRALTAVVDALPDDAQVGLLVYGATTGNTPADKPAGCRDVAEIAPIGPLDRPALTDAITSFDARGYTPIGLALEQAAARFDGDGPRRVILVSDGEDTCAPPDPCQVAADLAGRGIDLTIDTIGFQVDAATAAQLRCIADAAGGIYRDAASADGLVAELEALSVRAFRGYLVGGRPVQGGPTPQRAAELEPGLYRDTLSFPGSRWYQVDAQPGQQVVMSATVVGQRDQEHGDLSATTLLALDQRGDAGPLELCDRDFDRFSGTATVTVAARSDEIQRDGRDCEASPIRFRLHIDGTISAEDGDQAGPFDVEIFTQVVGDPEPRSEAPTGTERASAAGDADSDGAPGDDASDGGAASGGTSTPLVLLGALLGVGVGLAVARMRP